ncbi:hypothetical protein [Anaerosporobacter sp.]
MGINELEIEEYLRQINIMPQKNASVWGFVMPSVVNMALFGPMSNLFDMKYHILHFTNQEIVVIGVDSITGKMRPEHTIIARNQINKIQFKKGLIAFNLIIESAAGIMKYRINKTMVGAKWQKENLQNILSLNPSYL